MDSEPNIRFGIVTTKGLLEAVLRFRYKVYVEECGFESAAEHPHGLETDLWDAQSIHIAALDAENKVVGTIRLILDSKLSLPTINAMASFYEKPADISRAAEASRLAVDKTFRHGVEDKPEPGPDPKNQAAYLFYDGTKAAFPSQRRRQRFEIILGMFQVLYRVSHRMGIQQWYMMVEKSLWYFLRRYHILVQAMGPEMEFHGLRSPYFGNLHEMENHLLHANPIMARAFMDRLAKPLPALDAATPPGDGAPLAFPVPGISYADLLAPSRQGAPAAMNLGELNTLLWPPK